MLKYMIVLAGALVVLAATTDVHARGFRRSRSSCPNGQCYATVPAAPAKAVAMTSEAGATAVAAAPEVATPVTPATVAPAVEVTTNASYTVAPQRSAFRFRFFRRR